MSQDTTHRWSQNVGSLQDVGTGATASVEESGVSNRHHFHELRKFQDTELARSTWRNGRQQRESDGSQSSSRGDSKDYKDSDSLFSEEFDPLVRRPSDDGPVDEGVAPDPSQPENVRPVSWSELPKKSQLAILTLARLSEPLAQTSLQSYMFYQLNSFKLSDGSSPSDEAVARQAGILAAAFTGAQCVTAVIWGRTADRIGRKPVLLIGLLGTGLGVLGYGFSQSFATAVFWRCVAGLLNGNIGVMRTLVSEVIKEKRFQSRAFLLLPLTFNIGVIVGPLIGGLLADVAGSYPNTFGPGGRLGARWLSEFPYALPNVVTACFLLISAIALALGLEETLQGSDGRPDYGVRFTRWVGRAVFRIKSRQEYSAIDERANPDEDIEFSTVAGTKQETPAQQKLSFRRIWTSNVLFTLLSHGLLACHVGSFNSLWFVFLSTPRYDLDASSRRFDIRAADSYAEHTEPVRTPENYRQQLPFVYTGGLALSPSAIGTALAILGMIGITLQLLLYPPLSFRLGTVRSFRYSLPLFILSYTLTPYLAILPSSRAPPGQASGFFVWLGIAVVLLIQVTARTFALPASAILVNNSSPHPSVLGSLHGIAQSVSSATRTVGPVSAGYLYGIGLRHGIVGIGFWSLATVAVLGAIAAQFVREGDGHEIKLEGE